MSQDAQHWAACPSPWGTSAYPAAQMCWQTRDVLDSARVCSGRGDQDMAPHEQGRHWAETQLPSAGDGEGGSQPLHILSEARGEG